MKLLIRFVVLAIALTSVPPLSNAMWAKLSDKELIKRSDMIITAELRGQVQVTIKQSKIFIGVMEVEEVLKGDKNQTVILLVLPSSKGPHKSDDIFYKTGQKGLWFLREREAEGEAGLYLADHPQSFVSEKHTADKIKAIGEILEDR